MRVLELYDRDRVGGVASVVRSVSAGLAARGHEVQVLRRGEDGVGESGVGESGVGDHVHHLTGCDAPGPLHALAVVRAVRRLVREHRLDVVHVHHRRLALLAELAVRGSGVPVVEHVHSTFTDRRALSFRADVVVALSPSLAVDLQERYPHVRRLELCGNGVDVPDRVAEPGPEVSLVAIGRLESAKRPFEFGRLLERLGARGSWLGDGPLRAEMERRFGHVCELPGEVPSAEPWLRRAHAVVSTSVREGMPLSLMEGMALGLPVLARATGGIPDLVDARSGLLWTGDLPSREDCFALLDRRTSAGAHARERIASRFTRAQMVERVEQVLEGAT